MTRYMHCALAAAAVIVIIAVLVAVYFKHDYAWSESFAAAPPEHQAVTSITIGDLSAYMSVNVAPPGQQPNLFYIKVTGGAINAETMGTATVSGVIVYVGADGAQAKIDIINEPATSIGNPFMMAKIKGLINVTVVNLFSAHIDVLDPSAKPILSIVASRTRLENKKCRTSH